jgi:hypothetical protein
MGSLSMKNGLYSVHIHMLDGAKRPRQRRSRRPRWRAYRGRPLFLVDRLLHRGQRDLEGSPAHGSAYIFADHFVRPLFAGQEVTSGFSGTFADDQAEVFGTTLVGSRSLSFRATLKKLADI